MRLAQKDIDISRQGERLVTRHLGTAIPCERAVQLFWQLARLLYQCLNDAVAVLVATLCQHHKAGVALDDCGNEAVSRARDQIALPMPWYRTVFNLASRSRMEIASLDLPLSLIHI